MCGLRSLPIVLVLLSSPIVAHGQDLPGERWLNRMTISDRVSYIVGFRDAAAYAKAAAGLIPCDPQAAEKLGMIAVEDDEVGVLLEMMTQFYEDPANRRIHHAAAIFFAISKLDGTAENVLRERLENLRRSSRGQH